MKKSSFNKFWHPQYDRWPGFIKKKNPIVSTLFCVCNFLLRTCQFIFRCFVCATFWECYACLRVDFKRRFNAFRAKMWGWFYSTVQRDVTSVRILVHHSMDLFFLCMVMPRIYRWHFCPRATNIEWTTNRKQLHL